MAVLASEHRSRRELLLVEARNVGEGRAERFLRISVESLDHSFGRLLEHLEHLGVDVVELGKDSHGRGLDNLLRLGNANSVELYSGLALDHLNQTTRFAHEERNARSRSTSSSSTSRPVNVGLSFFGGLQLDNQVDVGDVETARGDISGDQNAEFAFFEALHGDFTLVLGNVSVHDLNVKLDLLGKKQRVSISFRLREHNRLALLSVNHKQVTQRLKAILKGTVDGQMLHISCSFVLQVHRKIHDSYFALHVSLGHIAHPSGDRSGKQAYLKISTALPTRFSKDLSKSS